MYLTHHELESELIIIKCVARNASATCSLIMVRLICAGESDSLVALLQRSTSAAQRMQVLECLQRETPDTRAKLAGDALCLGALEEWVLDLIEDRMSFHVLETLLKVRVPDAVWLQSVPGKGA